MIDQNSDLSGEPFDSASVVRTSRTDEQALLDCLRKIGKGLVAAGTAVGVVENTLMEIAQIYDTDCEIIALPNLVMIKLGESSVGKVDFTVQRLTTLQLDKVSEIVELIDQVKKKKILLEDTSQRMDKILLKKRRFSSAMVIFGYCISYIGLTMLFRPALSPILVTGTAGIMVGIMVEWTPTRPRFTLLMPVIAALFVSLLIFSLTRLGFIFGPANLLIPPLIIFLPGAVLTTGMIELASMHILSGSARLIYGAAILMLLFVGLTLGLYFSGLPNYQVYTYEAGYFPWWAPLVGTLLFGVGMFMRLSGANRDLLWMLVVLYVAMLGQVVGERFVNSYFGAFLGATLMALCSELVAHSPSRTPALVSQVLAFWFLVPGSRGLLSVTSLLNEDLQSAAIGIGEMIMLILSITLGVLLGTLLISPYKFVPVSEIPGHRPDSNPVRKS